LGLWQWFREIIAFTLAPPPLWERQPQLQPQPFLRTNGLWQRKNKTEIKETKKPNPDLNMLNYKFANKLNLPWDCDNGSELWLLLSFERDSLSPSPNPFFAATDYGKGSQQSSPILLLLGLCWIGFRCYVSLLTILGIYWANPINIFENVVVGMP